MKKENMNTFKRFLVICLTLGALVSTSNIVAFEKILHISVKSEEGMSGGPVIDTKTGGLIGIIKGHKNITLNNVSVRMDEYLYNIIVNHRAEMQ